jgi:hypothetical protein
MSQQISAVRHASEVYQKHERARQLLSARGVGRVFPIHIPIDEPVHSIVDAIAARLDEADRLAVPKARPRLGFVPIE